MLDLKKLITGFLILAAAASSSAIILSNIGNGAAATTATVADSAPTSSEALSGSAFAATDGSANADDPATLLGYQPSSTIDAEASDPNNLTNALAQTFLNNIVEANPNGIQTDASGSVSVAQPDNNTVLTQLSSNQAMSDITLPDWNAEAARIKLNIIQNSSPAAITSYTTALQNVFSTYLIQTNLVSLAASGVTDSADPGYVSTQITNALQAVAKIPTPAPAANFQKSLIKLFVYEKETLALTQDQSNDPLKNSLVIQAQQQNYNGAIQEFETALQKSPLAQQLSFLAPQPQENKNGVMAFFDNAMGIQTAHAQWLTFDASNFGEWVLKFAEDTALQIVKNAIITLVQKEVLTWVQGSGAPRFVQNWATASINAYQTAALNELNSQFQCVGTAQLPVLKLLLATPKTNGANNVCANQFNSQLGNNLTTLTNRLTNWNNYFALYQPGNYTWGTLLDIQDSVSAAGSQSAVSNQAKNVASQGFKGSAVCDDGSDPNGEDYQCNDDGDITPIPANGVCQNGDLTLEPNNGSCADGTDPQITTPGNVTAQGFGTALDSGTKLYTAATTIAGLLSALSTSLLNTLAQKAIAYSGQQLNSALSGSPSKGSAISDGGTLSLATSTPSSSTSIPGQAGPAVKCAPQVQSVSLGVTNQVTASLYGQGGAVDVACAGGNGCNLDENTDGTPKYYWTITADNNNDTAIISGGTDSNTPLLATFNATGTYYISVDASIDNTNATCEVDVGE